MRHASRAAFLSAALALASFSVQAGSPYPGYAVNQVEIFNPHPTDPYGGGLANVCVLQLYEAGDPTAIVGKCILKFQNKQSKAPYLLGIPAPSQFHISHPITGTPMWIVTDVHGEEHHTNDQLMLAAWMLKSDPAIKAGQSILLTVDGPTALIINGQ